MANKLYIDLETRSKTTPRKVGAYRYAEDPSTEVHCVAWALDGNPVRLWKMGDDLVGTPESEEASRWLTLIRDRALVKVAHNVEFEKNILLHKFGIETDISEWDDTAARAARMSLPRSLEEVGTALGLDEQKDVEGHRVMMKLARTRRVSKELRDEFWSAATKPEDFEILYEYCKQDVVTMRAVDRILPTLSYEERAIWMLTIRMNELGVKVDLDSIPAAEAEAREATRTLVEEFVGLTGVSPTSAKAAEALEVPNVKKETIREALKTAVGDRKRALELRKLVARSSVKKLRAFEARTMKDGRVRGSLMYAGAERTLRWAGGGVQPQNFPRGMGKLTEEAFVALSLGLFTESYEDVLKAIADMLRGFFVGPFLVGDFAQIEARVLAWLAGQLDLIETFRTGGDPYCEMASSIYRRPITKSDKDERFIGKTVVLGCFSAETLVLTGRGWLPIVDVQAPDTVWDGEEWVHHGGLLCQGEKDVLCWRGIGVTEDHPVKTLAGWEPASRVVLGSGNHLASALASGSSAWRVIFSEAGEEWPPSAYLAAAIVPTSTRSIPGTSTGELPLPVTSAPSSGARPPANPIGATPTFSPTTPTGPASSTGSPPASAAATTGAPDISPTTEGAGSKSTGRGERPAGSSSGISSPSRAGIGPNSTSIGSTLTGGTSQETSASSPAQRTSGTAGASESSSDGSPIFRKRCETYDLAFAGPRNRFLIYSEAGPLLVHNCGYGLGALKFQKQLDTVYDVQVELDFAESAVRAFRSKYSMIPRLWRKLEAGFGFAVSKQAKRVAVGPVYMGVTDVNGIPFAFIELPSGRKMYYAQPVFKDDGRVHYLGRNLYAGGRWEQVSTYGGKLTENIVQAISRDLLAQAMLRLDAAGFKLALTIHDEVVAQGVAEDLEAFERLLLTAPPWAEGLPLGVEAFHCKRYHK